MFSYTIEDDQEPYGSYKNGWEGSQRSNGSLVCLTSLHITIGQLSTYFVDGELDNKLGCLLYGLAELPLPLVYNISLY